MTTQLICNQMNKVDLGKDFVPDSLREFKEKIAGDEDLKDAPLDDEYLTRFLLSCHFNIDIAFKKLKSFDNIVHESPEWFASDAPSADKDLIEKNFAADLLNSDKDDRPIILVKLGLIDYVRWNITDVARVLEYWLEYLMQDSKDVEKNGVCVLMDVEGITWRTLRWLTPHNIRTAIRRIETIPVKDYRFHVVNKSFFLNAALKIIWPFLPEGIKKMIKFHFEDRESLYEYIAPEVLPEEYGGTQTLNFEYLQNKLFSKNREIGQSLKKHNTRKS